jgi:hypothetical protein
MAVLKFLQRFKTSHVLPFTNCNVSVFIQTSVFSGESCDCLRRTAVISLVLNVRAVTLIKHKNSYYTFFAELLYVLCQYCNPLQNPMCLIACCNICVSCGWRILFHVVGMNVKWRSRMSHLGSVVNVCAVWSEIVIFFKIYSRGRVKLPVWNCGLSRSSGWQINACGVLVEKYRKMPEVMA